MTTPLFNEFVSFKRTKEKGIGLNNVLVKTISCDNITSIKAMCTTYYHSGNANGEKTPSGIKHFHLSS